MYTINRHIIIQDVHVIYVTSPLVVSSLWHSLITRCAYLCNTELNFVSASPLVRLV